MKIPRILHFIWLGGPIPELYQEFRAEWQRLHPDWQCLTWTDESESSLPPPPASCIHARQRSNWMRLQILLAFGGVYVDLDTEPFKNIEPMLGERGAAASPFRFQHAGPVQCCNSFLAAAPQHPWIVECCYLLGKADPAIHLSMGSSLISEALRSHPEVMVLDKNDVLQWPGWHVLGRKPDPRWYAIHRFDNMKKPMGQWGT